jgi:excisionase family DNA binding protein
MEDDLLPVKELAAEVGVSPATVYGWRTRGEGPRAIKVGGQLRFRRSEINRWLEANSERRETAVQP